MKLPPPERGAVIRYAYLWADERQRGREEARKDRPSLVVAVALRRHDGQTDVMVLAITHTPPIDPESAVRLPDSVRKQLGLDDLPSWIVTTEANAFIWPGPDLRPVPGRKPATFIYGRIPDALLRKTAQSFLANRERQRTEMVARDS